MNYDFVVVLHNLREREREREREMWVDEPKKKKEFPKGRIRWKEYDFFFFWLKKVTLIRLYFCF